MENRPPLAPKPDSLKESPSHPSPTSSPSPSSAPPVPRPRKKLGAPPPAKPMPYRKHVELKDKEVSTFKSSAPVAPPRVRQRPAVPAAKPSPPSYRLSIPGEPSEMFQPKAESKGPVQYAIPQVPKRLQKPSSSATTSAAIDSRPRLNTPQVVLDPNDMLPGLDKQGEAAPIESHGAPSNYHQGVNGIAGGHDNELVSQNDEPELYTEAYAHIEPDENDAKYAVVSPSRTAIVPTPQSSSSLAAPVATSKSSPSPPRRPPPPVAHGRSSPIPPIAAGSQLHRSPSPAPPLPPPPSIQSIPTSHHPIPSSSSPLRDPSSVDGSIDDHEYNTTSHVKERVKKRSRGTPPIPPPTAPPTIRPRSTKSPSPPSAQISVGNDEYSMLDRPDKKPPRPAAPMVQPSSEVDKYSVLSSEPDEKKPPQASEFEESQVVPSTSCTTTEAEGYSRLDLDAIAAASSITNSSENALVYEEIRSESPVQDDTKISSSSSSFGPSPSPPVLPQMDKHPRVLARKASDKFKDEDVEATVVSSRDRSKLPAYQQPSMEKEDGARAKERGGARLPPRSRAPPPVPHPKRQKKMPGETASTPTNRNGSESANVGSSNSKVAVPLNVLERAGSETRNTPPPEGMEVERKPPTPNRRISPVPPAKARGSKPPPLPKPKQISPPTPRRTLKVATSGEQGPMKGSRESTPPATEGQSMNYEPICMSGDPEAVDGSHDSHVTGGVHVSSPKVELDIDHITQVGSVLADYDLENMAEALYDNQMVVDAVSLGGDSTSSPEQQKRASRTSYENQVVVDVVQLGNNRNSGAADGAMEVQQGGDGGQEQNLHRTSQGAEMEVSENGEGGDQIMESANGGDDACTKLTPSDVFTVPQHAVPGHLGYCDINVSHAVKNASSSEHQVHVPAAVARAQNQCLDEEEIKEGQGVDSGTFVIQPHAYPDSQGYCDIEIQQSPAAATQPGPIVVETADGVREGERDDSGTFVVQPHSYPDSHGYCDIEIQQSPAAATQPGPIVIETADGVREEGEGGGVGDDSGTFIVQPHAYPDSHGYCDIEVKQPPPSHSSTAAQPDSDANSAKTAAAVVNVGAVDEVVTDARGYCDIDIRPLPATNDKPRVKSSEVIVTDAHSYCDIDILPPPSSGANPTPSPAKDSGATKDPSTTIDDMVMDAQGYCDIDIKTPPPKSTSHEYEMVPESAERNSTSSKGGSKSVSPPSAGKAPPIPSTRPTKPGSKSVQDKESGESSSKKGVPPKRPPPRRRAPPPPPLKSKTVDDPSENSPQSSPLKKELVISTGLATLPRSPKKPPPKPPPPFASTNSPLLSKRMSPLVGKKLDLPSSSPQSSPLPPGSPNEQPQSSGIKKKFKGLFTKPKQTGSSASNMTSESPNAAAGNSSNSGGLVRRPSWGRRKKGKTKNDTPSPQDAGGAQQLSPSTKARSLPGYALHRSQGGGGASPPKLQLQCSYDADQEDDGDEFGIYSTIQENKLKPGSAEGEVVGGAVAAAAVVDDLKDDGVRHDRI